MKISNESFMVMGNFAEINESFMVEEPTVFKTKNREGTIISVYDTQETFPNFAIWDLRKFNSLVSVMGIESCEFDFEEEGIVISSGSRKGKYEYCDMATLIDFEDLKDSVRYKDYDQFDFSFDLTAEDIKEIKKVNSIFQFKEDLLKIEMTDGKGVVTVLSEDNSTASNYSLEIDGEGTGVAYTSINNLKIINGDYKCSVNGVVIKYQHKTIPLFYLIATRDIN